MQAHKSLLTAVVLGCLAAVSHTSAFVETCQTRAYACGDEQKQQLSRSLAQEADCPPWLADYAKFHQQQRGQPGARYLVQVADIHSGLNGGFGDRLRGALFTVRLAQALGRVALFTWKTPFELEAFFEPAGSINWSTRGLNVTFTQAVREYIDAGRQVLFGDIQSDVLQQSNETYLGIKTNRPVDEACAICPPVGSIWSDEASCFMRSIFKVEASIQQQTQQQLVALYDQPTPSYVAVHLRLGGMVGEAVGEHDERGKSPLLNVMAAIRCANALARKSSISLPILLITDSIVLREFLAENNLAGIITPMGVPVHTDKARTANLAVHQSTLVDMLLLSGAECLVASRSGFSELAWSYGGRKACFANLTDCMPDDMYDRRV